jgi:hypothetical protein
MSLGAMHLFVSVLGLDVIGEGLGLLKLRRVVVVVVILGTDVVHLVDAAALGASLDRALAGKAEPVNTVRVGRETSATGELLLASRSDHDGILHRSKAGGIKRAHVEDVDTLHLTENLQTLETGGLLEIGGDGTGGGTRTEEILLSLDLLQDLVRANLLLGGTSESSGLLVGGGRAVGGITASDGGSKGASDSRSGGDAASRGDGGALQEHCYFIGSGLRLAMRMTRGWAEREVEVLSRDL